MKNIITYIVFPMLWNLINKVRKIMHFILNCQLILLNLFMIEICLYMDRNNIFIMS